jgi:hypothetical protein
VCRPEEEKGFDTRKQVFDLGICLSSMLLGRVRHQDAPEYIESLVAEGRLRGWPMMRGVLTADPAARMPLGVLLDQLLARYRRANKGGKGPPVDTSFETPADVRLRRLEGRWWELLTPDDDAGVGESKSAEEADRRRELGEVTLELAREWEQRGKGYKALELYIGLHDSCDPRSREEGEMVTRALEGMSGVYQKTERHRLAKGVLERLVDLLERQQGPDWHFRCAVAKDRLVRALSPICTARCNTRLTPCRLLPRDCPLSCWGRMTRRRHASRRPRRPFGVRRDSRRSGPSAGS